jgi:chromosomal replication initiation ATPase DnaA
MAKEIVDKRRVQPIAEARQYSIWLTKKHLGLHNYRIAELFHMNISTIQQSISTINDRIETNQLRCRKQYGDEKDRINRRR